MTIPWPPPPDLASIQELVCNADVEGFVADGAPADEYDSEAEEFHAAIAGFPTSRITVSNLLPILHEIWRGSFSLDDAAIAVRYPALEALAQQVARFFGPEAQPLTRQTSPA
jgi:hypothetical protein